MSTAYVHKADRLLRRILVPCVIDKVDAGTSSNQIVQALWDTGANRTCISEALVARLNLMSDGQTEVTVADSNTRLSNEYCVQITMGKFTLPFIRVCELPMQNSGHDVIIGMDFMSKGDLSITNYNGKTVLTFREPSISNIDYVAEIEKYNKMYASRRKCGNELCPCGSGKAWKNCHGKQ